MDKIGRLTYIRVIYASEKIDKSIVDNFHAAKATGKAQRAMIATNSEFTEQAAEYALEVNIELMGGRELRELCQAFIDDAPRSDKATRPINRASLDLEIAQFMDQALFSFPKPPSTFISISKISPITFSPLQFYHFSFWQQFSNNSRTWVWDMNYPDHILVHSPEEKWDVVENRELSITMDLDLLTKSLEKEGMQYSINPAPPVKKLSKVKESIRQATTTEKSYKDQNNQQQTQVCSVNVADIEVKTSATFWSSCVDMHVNLGPEMDIELQLHEGKVSQVISQTPNEGTNLLDKTTIICQECQKITKPAKYFRNLTSCPGCGKVLCEDCGPWCSNCLRQITAGEKEKRKNPAAIKKLKEAFQEWQLC